MTPRRRGLRAVPPAPRVADVTAATSDELLAVAAPGLAFLDLQLTRRVAFGAVAGLPPPPVDADDVRGRIDRLRGVDLAGLAARAEDLRGAATALRGRHGALAEEAGVLWESWSGPAADDVAGHVVGVGRAAHVVVGVLEEIADRIEDSVVAVAHAVGGLAAAAATLTDATPLPDPADGHADGAGGGRRALRAATADLDARLQDLLVLADRTDATVAAVWADLAARTARLRATSTVPHAAGPGRATGPPIPDRVLDALLGDLALPVPSAVDPPAHPGATPGAEQLGPRVPPEPDRAVRPWRPRGAGPPPSP